jgi:hypothetical protein
VGLDGLDAQGAVAAASRQDDADGAGAAIVGEGSEKYVDRVALAMGGIDRPHLEPAVGDGQKGSRLQGVDVVRLDGCAIADLACRRFRASSDDLGDQTFALRRQVRDDDEGHAAVGRHGAEQSLEGFHPSGGGADPDDRERVVMVHAGFPAQVPRHRSDAV